MAINNDASSVKVKNGQAALGREYAEADLILPNLFIAGAAKSGTSSLHDYLQMHPQIFMSREKEPNFFGNPERFTTGLDVYSQLFAGARDSIVRGESSTGTLVFPGALERIRKHIKNPKFIVIFRQPTDRAFSHYSWLRSLDLEPRGFCGAFKSSMRDEPDAGKSVYGSGNYRYYYHYGCYGAAVKKIIDLFSRESLLIITTEQLRDEPLTAVNRCCRFLGVSLMNEVASIKSNTTILLKRPPFYYQLVNLHRNKATLSGLKSFCEAVMPYRLKAYFKEMIPSFINRYGALYKGEKQKLRLSAEDRRWLVEVYRDDVQLLKNLTSMEFSEWPDFMHIKVAGGQEISGV